MLFVEEKEERMGRFFSTYGTLLMEVPSFKYLGQTLSYSDNNYMVAEHNIHR